MPAGDRDRLVGARVGGENQGSLEAALYFSYAAEVDQKSAMSAEESLSLELLFKAIEATGGGQESSLIARQPDIVVVGLGITNFPRMQENPSIFSGGYYPARQRTGRSVIG